MVYARGNWIWICEEILDFGVVIGVQIGWEETAAFCRRCVRACVCAFLTRGVCYGHGVCRPDRVCLGVLHGEEEGFVA
jgi:hypothetical protein